MSRHLVLIIAIALAIVAIAPPAHAEDDEPAHPMLVDDDGNPLRVTIEISRNKPITDILAAQPTGSIDAAVINDTLEELAGFLVIIKAPDNTESFGPLTFHTEFLDENGESLWATDWSTQGEITDGEARGLFIVSARAVKTRTSMAVPDSDE